MNTLRWDSAYVNSSDAALSVDGKKLVSFLRADTIAISSNMKAAAKSFTISYDITLGVMIISANLVNTINNHHYTDEVIKPIQFNDAAECLKLKFFVSSSILYRIIHSDNSLQRKKKITGGVINITYVWCLPLGPTLKVSVIEENCIDNPDLYLTTDGIVKILWTDSLANEIIPEPTRSAYIKCTQLTYCHDRPITSEASHLLIDIYDVVIHAIKTGNPNGVYNRVVSALNYSQIYKIDLLSELMLVLQIDCLEVNNGHYSIISFIAGDIQCKIDFIAKA